MSLFAAAFGDAKARHMHRHPLPELVPIAWGLVALGSITLSIFILRYAPSNREKQHPTNYLVGSGFGVAGLLALLYAIILL